jgi:hypothetical protein
VIRRHVAVWVTHPATTTTLATAAILAGVAAGLALLVAAGPLPLLGAVFATTTLLRPFRRPLPAGGRPGSRWHAVAAGAAAPAPVLGCAAAGAAHTPARVVAGRAGRPAAGNRRPPAGRHRAGGTQLPARRGHVAYRTGRAPVRLPTHLDPPGGAVPAPCAAASPGTHPKGPR